MELRRIVAADVAALSRRTRARIALALATALTLWSLAIGLRPAPVYGPPPPAGHTDQALYRAIAQQVAAGDGYYDAVRTQHRALGFPLTPAVTVRSPVLAVATAAVGTGVMYGLLVAVALAGFVALALRFTHAVADPPARIAAMAIASLSAAILVVPGHELLHDIWAGLLIVLTLAVHRPGRWGLPLAIAFVAAVLRELALPFLLAMAAAALVERRWREAAAWAVAATVALALLGWHWSIVAGIAPLRTDVASPGWVAIQGWPRVLTMYWAGSVLALIPLTLAYVAVPLALIGWCGIERGLSLRAGLWLGGMSLAFAIFGRPDNAYWIALTAPLLPAGVAFAPLSLGRLWHAARSTMPHGCTASASS